jgi:hypothetical protein
MRIEVRITPATRAEEVRAVLEQGGTKTERLDPTAAAQAVTTATTWFSRANVRELTREEFRVLSRRWAGELEETAELSEEQRARLIRSLERAFDHDVSSMPVEQGIPRDPDVWRKAKSDAIQIKACWPMRPATCFRVSSGRCVRHWKPSFPGKSERAGAATGAPRTDRSGVFNRGRTGAEPVLTAFEYRARADRIRVARTGW